MTLADRFSNVFVAPGEVFESVRQGPPSTASWLVPFLLLCLAAVVHVNVLFSLETTRHQVREIQDRALDKKLGAMPAAQADKVRQMVELFNQPALLKVTGSLGALLGQSAGFFLGALFLWLVGTRLLGGQFGYGAALEICGLSGLIGLLGSIMTTLLMVTFGNILATPGPILCIGQIDPANPWHQVLASITVITFWQLAVAAVGLAKLSGARFGRALGWISIPWLLYRSGAALIGWVASRL